MVPRSTPWGTYIRIADVLRQRIADGELPPGAPLPSESALSQEFGVARTTVRRALSALEDEQLVRSLPGTGRIVRDPAKGEEPSGQPQYRRIAADLRDQIARGVLAPGAALPSETAIIERYGVSRGTVRQALSDLEGAGLIRSVHGKGRFVREPETPSR